MNRYIVELAWLTTGFSLGAAYQWWFQRGQCRSCRIRYSIRRLLRPIGAHLAARAPAHQRPLVKPFLGMLESAIAFSPMDSGRIGWYVFKAWAKSFAVSKIGRK